MVRLLIYCKTFLVDQLSNQAVIQSTVQKEGHLIDRSQSIESEPQIRAFLGKYTQDFHIKIKKGLKS